MLNIISLLVFRNVNCGYEGLRFVHIMYVYIYGTCQCAIHMK